MVGQKYFRNGKIQNKVIKSFLVFFWGKVFPGDRRRQEGFLLRINLHTVHMGVGKGRGRGPPGFSRMIPQIFVQAFFLRKQALVSSVAERVKAPFLRRPCAYVRVI